MAPPTRRQFLSSSSAFGMALVAGCGRESSTPSPDVDPTPVDSAYDLSVSHDIETWEKYDPDWESPRNIPAEESTLTVETVIEHLEVPWDLSFGNNGDLYISERVGRISRYSAGQLDAVIEPDAVIDHARSIEPSGDTDWWAGGSEGGLLGIALHPNYPAIPILYAFYTYDAGDQFLNRLVYYDVTDPTEETVILDEIPGHERIHNGARLTFGPQNYLWITTGDANDAEGSQQDDSLHGAVLRLQPDGTPPNETAGFTDPRIFSIGHRNPQGISFLPDGTPIVTDHGNVGRDEVQILTAGGNYGWPEAEDEGTYTGSEFNRPLVNTGPDTANTWAPSGAVFYTGDDVQSFRNRFLVGGLVSQRVNIVTIYAGEIPDIGGSQYDANWLHPDFTAVTHHRFADAFGRIRHVEEGPNGELYAITSNRDGRGDGDFPREGDDRLVRITDS